MKNIDRNEANLEERRIAAPTAVYAPTAAYALTAVHAPTAAYAPTAVYEEWAEPGSPKQFLESADAAQHEIRIRLAEFQAICNSLGEA